MSQDALRVVLLVPVFLFSLCVHEFAHAWIAVLRGDNTPRDAGRLSLHPMAHADILGTLILPIFCIYFNVPFFGWAKPVPVDVRNLKKGRTDYALVAAAGPLSNIILALLSTGLLFVLLRIPIEAKVLETVITFTVVSIQVNLMLAFFNLIPVPPLDGFNIFQGFLPLSAVMRLQNMLRYAGLVFLIMMVTGTFRYIALPVVICWHWLLGIAGMPT